jgi:hypothetical protein
MKLITILLFFWCVLIFAQPDTLWTRTYGGISTDYACCIQQTNDRGYIIVGATWPNGSEYRDIWLIKIDSVGNILWDTTYGGPESEVSGRAGVVQTDDGGYIITGYTRSFGQGSGDVWLLKTDSRGDTLWTRTYGGVNFDGGNAVTQTNDLGYVIVGATESFGAGGYDVWLIKTDSLGDSIWTKTFGGPLHDGCGSVVQTSGGGYILAGGTYSFGPGGEDLWLIKTNSSGDTLWTRTYGGSNYDIGYEVVEIY